MSIVLLPVATMWASSLPHPPASIIPDNSDNTTVYWAVICFKHSRYPQRKRSRFVRWVIGSSDLMSYSHSCGRSLSTLNILLPEACGQGWRTLKGGVVTVKDNSSGLRWEGPHLASDALSNISKMTELLWRKSSLLDYLAHTQCSWHQWSLVQALCALHSLC